MTLATLAPRASAGVAAGLTSWCWPVMVPVSAREGTDQLSAAVKAAGEEKLKGNASLVH